MFKVEYTAEIFDFCPEVFQEMVECIPNHLKYEDGWVYGSKEDLIAFELNHFGGVSIDDEIMEMVNEAIIPA